MLCRWCVRVAGVQSAVLAVFHPSFDLNGYIVVPNVLSREDVVLANVVVDRYQDQRTGQPKGRRDLRNMLGFPPEDRAPFARMLAHPKLTRYLNTIVGTGFRMDHAPTLITMERGDPAAGLHGSSGYNSWTGDLGFNPLEYYLWRNGRMHNGLVVAAFALVDYGPGDGVSQSIALLPAPIAIPRSNFDVLALCALLLCRASQSFQGRTKATSNLPFQCDSSRSIKST